MFLKQHSLFISTFIYLFYFLFIICCQPDTLRFTLGPITLQEQFAGYQRQLKETDAQNVGQKCQEINESNCPFAWDIRSIVGLIMTFIGAALANAAGVGGGALFVPLFHVLVGFGLKSSTALSQAVITGGALASVCFNLFQPHPLDDDRPLIDFQLSLILSPTILFGVSLGVLFNDLLPEWLLFVGMTLMLSYLAYRPLVKGINMWKLEKIKRAQSRRSIDRTEIGGGEQGLEERQIKSLEKSLSRDHPMQLYTYCATPLHQEGEFTDVELENGSSEQDIKINTDNQVQQIVFHKTQKIKAVNVVDKETYIKEQSTASVNLLNNDAPFRPSDAIYSHAVLNDRERLLQSQPSGSSNGDKQKLITKDDYQQNGFESFGIESAHTDSTPKRSFCLSKSKLFQSKCIRRIPFLSLLQLSILWVLFLACSILKTLDGRCNSLFWLMWFAQAVLVVIATLFFIWLTLKERRQTKQELCGSESSVEYKTWGLIRLSCVTMFAGAVAGLMGIGGGMIVGPVLIMLGVMPQVTAATSAVVVLFSSSSATLQFALDNRLNTNYASVFGMMSMIASVIGIAVVSQIVKKSGRPSIIVLILAFIIGVGAMLTGVFGAIDIIDSLQNHEYMGFNALCD